MKNKIFEFVIILIFGFAFYIVFNNLLLNLVAIFFGEEKAFFIEGNWCNIQPGQIPFKILLPVLCYVLIRYLVLEALYRLRSNNLFVDLIRMFCLSIYFFDLLSVLAYYVYRPSFDYFFSNSLPQFLSAKIGLPVYVGNLIFGLLCAIRFKDLKVRKKLLLLVLTLIGSFVLWGWVIERWV